MGRLNKGLDVKLKLIIALFIVFGLVFILKFFLFNETEKNKSFNFDENTTGPKIIIPVQSQKSSKRNIKELNTYFLKKINLEDLNILQPYKICSVDSNFIYILDFSVPCVKQLNLETHNIKIYGKGKGTGPGELLNPTDFAVDGNKNVWILDGAQNSILKFDSQGNFLFSFKPNYLIYRVGVNSQNKIYLVSSSSKNLFYQYNENQFIKSFGEIISEQEKFAILLSGKLSIDNNDNLYFTTDRSYLLISYKQDGELRFAISTIEGDNLLPKPSLMNKDIIVLPKKFTNIDIRNSASNIFILNREGMSDKSFIDIYSNLDGLYKYSFVVPHKILSFSVILDKLFFVDDYYLYIYNFK